MEEIEDNIPADTTIRPVTPIDPPERSKQKIRRSTIFKNIRKRIQHWKTISKDWYKNILLAALKHGEPIESLLTEASRISLYHTFATSVKLLDKTWQAERAIGKLPPETAMPADLTFIVQPTDFEAMKAQAEVRLFFIFPL